MDPELKVSHTSNYGMHTYCDLTVLFLTFFLCRAHFHTDLNLPYLKHV